ncbi:class I SAM-dependent methyltransferase [Brevibacterium aurantiacum]|uniref:Methyltransferase domain-containing protein n=1 Tax=Brevibacterium aurantiacum TaxID=273384 RepID=A0A2H1IJ84_BREAU|nr:methyltransferase domain-containing protein [Brevibacterium aurantiacum]SMX75221.1 Methyltransferase domain-containing protein [Brevibacterium aurantiacum]
MTETIDFAPLDALNAAMAGHACDVVRADGTATRLNVQQWTSAPDATDHALFLDRCMGPTLDVGCGAGRLTGALTARGQKALGIDISLVAVKLAQERGAVAVHMNVFADVPDEGCWQNALLADGNVGIGGDPVRLLRRIRQLVRPDGSVLVEVDAPGPGLVRESVRLRVQGQLTGAFNWSQVDAEAIADVAAAAGFHGCRLHQHEGRYMASLTRDGHA